MDAASPEKPMLTVALDVPSAYILADQAAIIHDSPVTFRLTPWSTMVPVVSNEFHE